MVRCREGPLGTAGDRAWDIWAKLEKALKSVGKDWDKVAELVEGRSAKDCKTRFKELAKAIKAKKAKK